MATPRRVRLAHLQKQKDDLSGQSARKQKEAMEEKSGSPVSNWVMGFLIFVVVGSTLLQILQTARTAPGRMSGQ